jgi:hypothetical protein
VPPIAAARLSATSEVVPTAAPLRARWTLARPSGTSAAPPAARLSVLTDSASSVAPRSVTGAEAGPQHTVPAGFSLPATATAVQAVTLTPNALAAIALALADECDLRGLAP